MTLNADWSQCKILPYGCTAEFYTAINLHPKFEEQSFSSLQAYDRHMTGAQRDWPRTLGG